MPFDLTEDARTAAMISGSGRRHCVPGSSWWLGGDCGGEGGSGDGNETPRLALGNGCNGTNLRIRRTTEYWQVSAGSGH